MLKTYIILKNSNFDIYRKRRILKLYNYLQIEIFKLNNHLLEYYLQSSKFEYLINIGLNRLFWYAPNRALDKVLCRHYSNKNLAFRFAKKKSNGFFLIEV